MVYFNREQRCSSLWMREDTFSVVADGMPRRTDVLDFLLFWGIGTKILRRGKKIYERDRKDIGDFWQKCF